MKPTLTDSYKTTQWNQYPPETTEIDSYASARHFSDEFVDLYGKSAEVVPFGLQYQLLKHVAPPTTAAEVASAHKLLKLHFGRDLFNLHGWMHIVEAHNGLLPIDIRAVPEGTPIPVGNALFTIENTCPECYWVTNYVETALVQTWYPTAVATQSREIKKTILRYLEQTGDPSTIDFKLHDFGFRGASSVESAGIGGLAHLVNFRGTDTLQALEVGRDYYGCECAGYSIYASEHSTITSWGRDGEVDAFRNMLRRNPTDLIACVSDSYDIWNACEKLWGEQLRAEVLGRSGTLVVRPDSGKPIELVVQKVVDILAEKFGATRNAKGYNVIDPHVRVIQGDGVNGKSIDKVLWTLQANQFSADNIGFGMGSALLQEVKRDDIGFALKCSSAIIDGQRRDVYKDPITDHGKKSHRGRVALVLDQCGYRTVRDEEAAEYGGNLLRPVFHNGYVTEFHQLDTIRSRAALGGKANFRVA